MVSTLYLVLASFFEVLWATGLKIAMHWYEWLICITFIILSFVFLLLATRKGRPAIVYVYFVTLGTVGTYFVDVFFYSKELNILNITAVGLILFSIYKLKSVEA
ncbi:SMR family transporter [Pectobacterium aroidearum]|uniref:DMT family transporter n=1 Tax=Pectobacterium aroidearum TaxID=1201031 RepID=UPI0031580AAA